MTATFNFRGSIGDRIHSTGGYTSGFDYLRIVLAVLVVYGHSFLVSGDNYGPKIPVLDDLRGYGVLPVFFCLSGFLVSASLLRSPTLKVFLGLRALRIAPALIVEISLSALILGPFLTKTPLYQYFLSMEFFRYFLNVFGWPQYLLPGLFVDNPVGRTVNGNLWTVPYEGECYIALSIIALLRLSKLPRVFFILFAVLSVLAFAVSFRYPTSQVGTPTGRQLVLFFIGGAALYLNRDIVPYSGWLAVLSALISLSLITSPSAIFLAPIPVSYLTAYIGLTTPIKAPIIFTGDYSYGIYLYGYPIQQAVYQLTSIGAVWWGNFFVTLLLLGIFAAFSWHVVEKPTLKLKRFLRSRSNSASLDEMISPDKTRVDVAEADTGTKQSF